MGVHTRADHPTPSLRGRRYALPFDRVWEALSKLASRPGLETLYSDDQSGRMVLAHRSLAGLRARVVVDAGLDEEGQTRVDVAWNDEGAAGVVPRPARRSGQRLQRRLDRKLGAPPGTVLDPGGAPRAVPVSPPEPPAPSFGA
ncbi:MAG: hypothetical protein EA352_11945 [Gemmatimonadales bacterium]|nr:MAG: hypothetical protein EA352_11945 [Gemmatimonadales bacterium]